MDKILKITKIFFFSIWGIVGFFVLLFFIGLFIFNPFGRIEQGLKQLEKVNQLNTPANLPEKDRQVGVSDYLSSVLSEKMKVCFVTALGEKRFSEVDRNPGNLTKDDQQKLVPCIAQESFSRQPPFGITGFTSAIVSPFPTKQ